MSDQRHDKQQREPTEEGRLVPPHRSGGGEWVGGLCRSCDTTWIAPVHQCPACGLTDWMLEASNAILDERYEPRNRLQTALSLIRMNRVTPSHVAPTTGSTPETDELQKMLEERKRPPMLAVAIVLERMRGMERRLLASSATATTIKDQRDALRWLQERVFTKDADSFGPDRHARGCIQEVLNNMEGGATAEPAIKGPLRPTDGGAKHD